MPSESAAPPQFLDTAPAPRFFRTTRPTIFVGLIVAIVVLVAMTIWGVLRNRDVAAKPPEPEPVHSASATGKALADDLTRKTPPIPITPPAVPPVVGEPPIAGAQQPLVSYQQPFQPAQRFEKPLSPAEQDRYDSWKREQDAIAASGGSEAASSNAIQQASAQQAGAQAPAAPASSARSVGSGTVDEFLEAGRERSSKTYLGQGRVAPVSAYQVMAGTRIPITMEQKTSLDLPGYVTALVASNVFDTATLRNVLIPQGARLIGEYQSNVEYGQSRLPVIWDRIIFPDSSSMLLEGMPSQSIDGQTGLHDKVNRHYARSFGQALLTSMFAIPSALSQNRNRSVLQYPGAAQSSADAVSQQMSQFGMEITRKNVNVPPTIWLRPGQTDVVFVNHDLIFDGPYAPMAPSQVKGRK